MRTGGGVPSYGRRDGRRVTGCRGVAPCIAARERELTAHSIVGVGPVAAMTYAVT